MQPTYGTDSMLEIQFRHYTYLDEIVHLVKLT